MKRKTIAIITVLMLVLSIVSFRYAVNGNEMWIFLTACSGLGVFGGLVGCIDGTAIAAWLKRTFIDADDE